MKSDFVLNLQRKRSNYSHPDQATSQANSLVLLSSNKEYFIVRVFDIDTDSPDIYIFNGNLLSYENLENIIES